MSYKKLNQNLPLVVIFGRTNVGKSTLFNTLLHKKKALTANMDGTTRDANTGVVEWGRHRFNFVDTGGIIDLKYLSGNKIKTDDIEAKVQKQARDYLKRADLILFLVDVRTGLLPQDRQLALILKKQYLKKNIPPLTKGRWPKAGGVILVANKADSPRHRHQTAEFNKLALGEPLAVSAANGSGTGDLLDRVVAGLDQDKKSQTPARDPRPPIQVCILGKPNVGKSSLINAILGEDRTIVSPTPHTTREPQDTLIEYKDMAINLIDTAGISKQGQKTARRAKNKNTLSKISIKKSLSILKRADIAVLVLDIKEGITHQDAKLVEEIINSHTSLIIVANKWDLVEERNTKVFTNMVHRYLPFADWAPIQFTSALTGSKVDKVLDQILLIKATRNQEISQSRLDKFLNRAVKMHTPTASRGSVPPYIYKIAQVDTDPPTFAIRIKATDKIHYTYLKFIENQLREQFGFLGTPLAVYVDKKRKVHGKHEINKP